MPPIPPPPPVRTDPFASPACPDRPCCRERFEQGWRAHQQAAEDYAARQMARLDAALAAAETHERATGERRPITMPPRAERSN